MDDATLWWVLAGALVAAELTSGTFLLLMLALGAVGGAVAAHAGLGVSQQLLAAAGVAGMSVAAWAWRRLRHRATTPPAVAELDIGQTVYVAAWDADGTARVRYRGAEWVAEALPGSPPHPGAWRIHAVHGNRLVLQPAT
ncbi:membrane protein implicated in regulation of membrane protease activity [Tepidimonas ignava]|jgi:membrane protein implicated in regulation of membrane protease activity|uniref:Membrane protein implicated in regulation of membrane protease activity n=1 Tax=Tepidimonas ignava TaxID=114249 RepID=A0A4R3LH15_9BURK|nr:NfeD family protein [Tepidimonas ignava]TCS99332.1 membrane protein implicated in regulation of membrane protease activity [Tepidimonas ignava]TSE24159.1 hypothetical protein Tigna_00160 [Tepidimonas ignava]